MCDAYLEWVLSHKKDFAVWPLERDTLEEQFQCVSIIAKSFLPGGFVLKFNVENSVFNW